MGDWEPGNLETWKHVEEPVRMAVAIGLGGGCRIDEDD